MDALTAIVTAGTAMSALGFLTCAAMAGGASDLTDDLEV